MKSWEWVGGMAPLRFRARGAIIKGASVRQLDATQVQPQGSWGCGSGGPSWLKPRFKSIMGRFAKISRNPSTMVASQAASEPKCV